MNSVSAYVREKRLAGSGKAPARAWISHRTLGHAVELIEALVVTLGSVLGQMAYHLVSGNSPGDLAIAVGVGLLSSILYVSIARSAGLYTLPNLLDPTTHVKRNFGVCVVVLLSLTAIFFSLKIGSDISRGALVAFAAFLLILCSMARFGAAGVIRTLLDQGAIAGRPAFLIGDPDELSGVTPAYLLRHFGLQEVGRQPLSVEPSGQIENIGSILDLARLRRAREFVVVSRLDSQDAIERLRAALRVSPLAVRLMPNRVLRSLISNQYGTFETSDHLIELQRAPMGAVEQFNKRLMDLMIAILAIVALLPVFVIAAVAIKLDTSGPIIFRQKRAGFDQRPFTIFKFRSMTVAEDGPHVVQATRDDRRVTKVGRILRRTSIDELPQLFNVLLGDMSAVGPRPHAMAHDAEYKLIIGDYCMRQHVKPGITGWAQVNGFRGETSQTEAMARRVELDIWYVNNRSFLMDIRILLRTCFEVLGHEAY